MSNEVRRVSHRRHQSDAEDHQRDARCDGHVNCRGCAHSPDTRGGAGRDVWTLGPTHTGARNKAGRSAVGISQGPPNADEAPRPTSSLSHRRQHVVCVSRPALWDYGRIRPISPAANPRRGL